MIPHESQSAKPLIGKFASDVTSAPENEGKTEADQVALLASHQDKGSAVEESKGLDVQQKSYFEQA